MTTHIFDIYSALTTSDHMKKVRETLLNEKQSIEASEKAKAQRQMKKFGKMVRHVSLFVWQFIYLYLLVTLLMASVIPRGSTPDYHNKRGALSVAGPA